MCGILDTRFSSQIYFKSTWWCLHTVPDLSRIPTEISSELGRNQIPDDKHAGFVSLRFSPLSVVLDPKPPKFPEAANPLVQAHCPTSAGSRKASTGSGMRGRAWRAALCGSPGCGPSPSKARGLTEAAPKQAAFSA